MKLQYPPSPAASHSGFVHIGSRGPSFEGFFFTTPSDVVGELVFTTGMVGYPETLTDPSYHGQIVVFTYPLIGNYGVPLHSKDSYGIERYLESDIIHVRGVVLSQYAETYSHFSAKESLAQWLNHAGVPGLTGVDTRALTTHLRTHGTRAGSLSSSDTPVRTQERTRHGIALPVAEVSTKTRAVYGTGGKVVLLIDCGVKSNIVRSLLARNVTVVRVPWDHDISREEYDGILISNGPGDPAQCTATIQSVATALKGTKPIFGICLGNQLLALAAGGQTYKLPYGHRSQNQPCVEVGTQRCVITSQNHGYAVNDHTLPSRWCPWFTNANDGTNEGIRHVSKPFFSVQFHPEAAPGPTDTSYLFDDFISLL